MKSVSQSIADLLIQNYEFCSRCYEKIKVNNSLVGVYGDDYNNEEDWENCFRGWELNGRKDNPPEIYKHVRLEAWGKEHNIKCLIETGACLGNAAYFNRDNFDKIYTVELDDNFYTIAHNKLKNFPHIELYHGSSVDYLRELLPKIDERCLFWLDANHQTTLRLELAHILNHHIKDHIILIDDYRLFGAHITKISVQTIMEMASTYGLKFSLDYDAIRLEGDQS